jgi:hypothetical protein
MFVQYPKTIERLTIRKFNRIKSKISYTLLFALLCYIALAKWRGHKYIIPAGRARLWRSEEKEESFKC